MQEFESECAPFQYALSTRAGTDCLGHFLKAATDANTRATILSVDGVGAYDHVLRSAMLERLLHMPKARAILPFVRLSYGSPSSYSWEDDAGTQRKVTQAEGEQVDPLMPLLFSTAIHAALEAFLDDVYVLCLPHRVVPLFKVLRESLDRVAGIRLHEGKTKVWNRSGTAPEDIEELGEEAWQPEGLKVLGTPIGSPQFTAAQLRVGEERRFWDAIPTVKNLQCAWQLLLQSANPRANHTLRTLPPSLSGRYAQDHDDGIWATVEALLQQVPGEVEEQNFAREIATLPMRMGGLGLRSATRCAAAAYWASWADALAMISQRNRGVANLVVRTMEGELPCPQGGCLAEVLDANPSRPRRLLVETILARTPRWQEAT